MLKVSRAIVSIWAALCPALGWAAPDGVYFLQGSREIKVRIVGGKVVQEWGSSRKVVAEKGRKAGGGSGNWILEEDPLPIIQRKAEAEYPSDFRMQSFVIRSQKEAVRELEAGPPTGFPFDVFGRIREKAKKDYPTDYKMRRFVEKQQVRAFLALTRDTAPNVPRAVFDLLRAKAQSDYPGDYEMQRFVEKRQVEAYGELQKLRYDAVPAKVLRRIRSKAAQEYPVDFQMQLATIKRQVVAWQEMSK